MLAEWADPLFVGCQTARWDGIAGWCHTCATGNAALDVPWLPDPQPLCWWCGGDLTDARP